MNKTNQRNIGKNISTWKKYRNEISGLNIKDKIFTEELLDVNNIIYFDQTRPDLIVNNEQLNIVFGIEHFEFNNSIQNNNGGSVYSQKSNVMDKLHQKKEQLYFEKLIDNEIILTSDSFKINASSNNFYESFKVPFKSHYNKVDIYKEKIRNIGNENTKYKLGFLVEDTSPLGSITLPDFKNIHAYEILEIMSLVAKSERIDFIIFAHTNSKESIIFWRENLVETLNNQELISIQDLELVDPEIWEIRSTMKIT